MNPDVSILTPIYADTPEKVQWLGRAIESVRAQMGVEWEMIIVDDFSPLSLDGVKEVFSKDNRLRWVRTTDNRGPAMARNTAAALARADALLPLDADDELAAPDIVAAMYSMWSEDQGNVIYGDMRKEPGGKIIRFAEYTFTRALNLQGIFPVTAMHSKECHDKAGGWKPEFDHGLEDVEYWICAGAAGFCGRKLQKLTLIYHSYDDNRSQRMMAARQRSAMEDRIKEVHADLYEGRYPMGCCGGSRATTTYTPPRAVNSPALGLDAIFSSQESLWVRYNGEKKGKFGIVSKTVPGLTYWIDGQGCHFEVLLSDVVTFRRSGRGVDFSVGVAPPAPEVEELEPEVEVVKVFEAPPPQLSEIEYLDPVAAGTAPPLAETAKIELEETVEEEVNAALDQVEMMPTELEEAKKPNPLAGMETVGQFQEVLESEAWTIPMLARAEVSDLTPYFVPVKGIGKITAVKMAEDMIAEAKTKWQPTQS